MQVFPQLIQSTFMDIFRYRFLYQIREIFFIIYLHTNTYQVMCSKLKKKLLNGTTQQFLRINKSKIISCLLSKSKTLKNDKHFTTNNKMDKGMNKSPNEK